MKKISVLAVMVAVVFLAGQGLAYAGAACCAGKAGKTCDVKQNFGPKNKKTV